MSSGLSQITVSDASVAPVATVDEVTVNVGAAELLGHVTHHDPHSDGVVDDGGSVLLVSCARRGRPRPAPCTV